MSARKFQLLKSALFISTLGTISTVLAFVVQLILAKKYGASIQMDAYFAALAIPQVFLRLLALPLRHVFVPMFKDLEHKSSDKAERFAMFIFWAITGCFFIFGLVTFVFSTSIAHIIIPGSPEKTIVLTATILKILAWYVFFAGLFFLTQTIQQAYEKFSLSYLANALSNIITIAYTAIFIKEQGILAAVIGLTLGTAAQLVVNLLTMPISFFKRPHIEKHTLRAFLILFIPLGIGSLIYRSTPIIDRYFASFLPSGDISLLGYGLKFLESIVGFLSTGLAIVLLPISSEMSAKTDGKNLSNIFSWGIRATSILIMPSIFYIMFFGNDMIRALFERGNFTVDESNKLSLLLVIYMGALFALSIGGQMTNIFYVNKKHLQVVLINLGLLPVYIILTKILSSTIGVYGIASAYSIYTVLSIFIYVHYIRRQMIIPWKEINKTAAETILSSLFMIGVIFALVQIPYIHKSLYIKVLVECSAGALSYFCALYLIKNKEIGAIHAYIFDKVKSRHTT